MGKVYDALRRAEEQRAQRVQETAESAVTPAVVADAAMPTAGPLIESDASVPRKLRSSAADLGAGSAADLNKRRIALLQPESFVAEQFRTLRARIDAIASDRPLKSIAVTSARRGDGKTTAAISLAAVTAMQPGRRVLLIDCDLRSPAVGASLGLRVDAGLAEVLSGSASLEQAVCRADGADLDVLAVRSIPQNPSELLASSAMGDLIAHASASYDRVVLDLPPTLGLPDAKTTSGLCDGVVFLVRADHTPAPDVEAAVEIIGRSRIVGLVMNGGADESTYYGSDK